MAKRSSLKKGIVNVLIGIGGLNVVCLCISVLFVGMVALAVISGHRVSDSGLETFVRGYIKFTFNTSAVITILSIISIIIFVGFVNHEYQKEKKSVYKKCVNNK